MKKRYIFLAVVLFTNILLAQRGDDFMSDDGFDDLYSLTPCYVDCGSTEVGNFYFGSLSFNNALSNQALLERAKLASMRAWFNTQKGIIKSHIERKFYKSFNSYDDAKDALFASSEASNIATNLPIVTNQYAAKKNTANTIQKGVAKNLKLLEIRKAELSIGTYAIQKYPYIKVNGKALKDITSLAVLEAYKSVNSVTFQTNEITLNDANNMYYFLRDMATNDDFKNKIVALKNSYYSSFSDWNELNYMQFLINYEELKRLNAPPQYNPQLLALFAQFKDTDIATTSVIEDYALNTNNGIVSIFEESYIYYLAAQIGNGIVLNSHISTARTLTEQKRAEALNDLLDDVDTTALAIENLIGQLNITDSEQTSWLYNNEDEAISFVDFLEENGYRGVPTSKAVNFVKSLVETLSTELAVDKNTLAFTLESFNQDKLYNAFDVEFLNSIDKFTTLNLDTATLTANPQMVLQLQMYFTLKCAVLRHNNPKWSDAKIYWEASKEIVHITLDVFGTIPVAGEIADLANGILYLIDGDNLNATLSFAATIPIAGWTATGSKYAVKIVKASTIDTKVRLAWKVLSNGVIYFGSSGNKLRKVLGITDAALHAHHLIPWATRGFPMIQKAASSKNAFHINEALNGIPMPNNLHLTGHSKYSSKLQSILTDNYNDSMTSDAAYNFVKGLTQHIGDLIKNNPALNSGQIADLITYK